MGRSRSARRLSSSSSESARRIDGQSPGDEGGCFQPAARCIQHPRCRGLLLTLASRDCSRVYPRFRRLSLRGSLLVQQQRRIVQLEDELQRAWAEIERLRGKLTTLERERQPNDEDGSRQPRYWTPEEHALFVEAVQRYGWKDVKAISQHVGTRNPTQVRTHAQKLLLRQQKEQAGVMQSVPNGRELPPLPPNMLAGAPSSADVGEGGGGGGGGGGVGGGGGGVADSGLPPPPDDGAALAGVGDVNDDGA